MLLCGLIAYAVIRYNFNPLSKEFIFNIVGALAIMIIEVVLIIGFVNWLTDRKWEPTRKHIRQAIFDDAYSFLVSIEWLKNGHPDKYFIEAELRSSTLIDRLQYLTPAMTPELTDIVRRYTYHKEHVRSDYEGAARTELDREQAPRRWLDRLSQWVKADEPVEELEYPDLLVDIRAILRTSEFIEVIAEILQRADFRKDVDTYGFADEFLEQLHPLRIDETVKRLTEMYATNYHIRNSYFASKYLDKSPEDFDDEWEDNYQGENQS